MNNVYPILQSFLYLKLKHICISQRSVLPNQVYIPSKVQKDINFSLIFCIAFIGRGRKFRM